MDVCASLTYRRTLYQPYAVHVARNSSEVIAGITNKATIASTNRTTNKTANKTTNKTTNRTAYETTNWPT